jgi:tetratricopeptide (TPR) repeat protein
MPGFDCRIRFEPRSIDLYQLNHASATVAEQRGMRLPRVMTRRWVVVLSLFVVLGLLAIWIFRPGSSAEWLGLDGLGKGNPIAVVRQWAAGGLAPLSPLGFLSLFATHDLLLAGALLTAALILAVMLSAPAREVHRGPWLAQSVGEFRVPRIRIRVRTILVLIAIVGIELGWEIVASRKWRLSEQYFARAHGYRNSLAFAREQLRFNERQLARLDAGDLWWIEDGMTSAARAAEKAYRRDRIREQMSFNAALVGIFDELERKYEAAANNPFEPVAADPPRPESWEARELSDRKEYKEALASYDRLISRYPDLFHGHYGRAHLLATCPDARFRNGKEAVASATRACDLTTWQNPDALAALAAAHAEAGDFARAVAFEQKALDLYAPVRWLPDRWRPDRMAAYKAGRPYRDPR